MNTNPMVLDTLHELAARDEERQVAVLGLGAALPLARQATMLAM
jgi:hypothetical protein